MILWPFFRSPIELKTNSNWFKYPIKPNWYWISIDQYCYKTVLELTDLQPVSLPLNLHGTSAACDHFVLLYFASGLSLAVSDSASVCYDLPFHRLPLIGLNAFAHTTLNAEKLYVDGRLDGNLRYTLF